MVGDSLFFGISFKERLRNELERLTKMDITKPV
jgi:hypothetical protein